jgi:hypothetical protein
MMYIMMYTQKLGEDVPDGDKDNQDTQASLP